MKTVTFRNVELEVRVSSYVDNDNTALVLMDPKTSELYMVATTNLDMKLDKDVAFIKDYSENEGILGVLQEAGIVLEEQLSEFTGYLVLTAYKLNLEGLAKE